MFCFEDIWQTFKSFTVIYCFPKKIKKRSACIWERGDELRDKNIRQIHKKQIDIFLLIVIYIADEYVYPRLEFHVSLFNDDTVLLSGWQVCFPPSVHVHRRSQRVLKFYNLSRWGWILQSKEIVFCVYFNP